MGLVVVGSGSKDAILRAAKKAAQAHGYAGLNFRTLADEIGIKHASLYHHFPNKADLGAAVARRYWEEAAVELEAMTAESDDPTDMLRRYPTIFRRSLENENRLCLCSFMAAEYDDLPGAVKIEVQAFADVNAAWLARTLASLNGTSPNEEEARAKAIFAAVAGAQLFARSRADIALFDDLIATFRVPGLLGA